MTQEYQIRVQPHVAANEQALRSFLADEYGFDVRTLTAVRILRRSIDARQRLSKWFDEDEIEEINDLFNKE